MTTANPSPAYRPGNSLFFIRRRPTWHVSRQWVKPADYAKCLKEAGFVADADVDTYARTTGTSAEELKTVRTAVEFMLKAPVLASEKASFIEKFFEFDQAALHYQNAFYLYQWVFIIGAFLTTLFSIISVVVVDPPGKLILWLFAALLGLITTVYTVKNNTEKPQFEWYTNRRRAETLRHHYYLYLSHLRPYVGTDENRQIKIGEAVRLANRIGTQRGQTSPGESEPAAPTRSASPGKELTDAEIKFLTDRYCELRLQCQTEWYKNRKAEFWTNIRFALIASAVLITLSPILAAINAFAGSISVLGAIATLLPSAAAAIVAFQQIYSWDRQRALYDETILKLADASITFGRGSDAHSRANNFAKAVLACESVFTAESDQWGQGVLDREIPSPEALTHNEFARLVSDANLTEQQKADIYRILDAPNQGKVQAVSMQEAPKTGAAQEAG